MSPSSVRGVLVPVGDSVTIRNTVAYVVREVLEEKSAADGPSVVHFVFPVSWQRRNLDSESWEESEELLDRIETWVREDLDVEEDEEMPIDVVTEMIGADQYLFSPRDYAEILLEYAREHELGHIVLDPEFKPGAQAPLLTPLAAELELSEDITYEEAPVERQVRGQPLLRRAAGIGTFVTLFGLSFLFYQVIGGFAKPLDYVTGAASAAVVAAVLSGITFEQPVSPVRAVKSTLRWVIYLPYLFWEIAKANLQVAYIVLHPSLPIEPRMEKFQPAVPVGLPVTTLANSITLTPGTITVDVRERDFYIHTLTQSARDSLFEGGLERATRFVFFGREASDISSPSERGQKQGELQAEQTEDDSESSQSVVDDGGDSK
jgi:multicomponent Na+:H+ antiporter subunit E